MTESLSIEALHAEYCPPLDDALFFAIASDFDLTSQGDEAAAREILDGLKASAIEQQDLPFDPSGFAGRSLEPENSGSRSDYLESDLTGLTSNISSLDFTSSAEAEQVDPETLNTEGKHAYLKEMFPTVSDYTIEHTLKKNDGVVFRSIDVLLNHTFLEDGTDSDLEAGGIPRGVTGFVGSGNRRKRKGKRQVTRSQGVDYETSSNAVPASTPQNRWESAKSDVEKIATLMGLPTGKVVSLYNAHDMSIGTTIQYIMDLELRKIPTAELRAQPEYPLTELMAKFPSSPKSELVALLRLTGNSAYSTEELVNLMNAKPYYVHNGHPIKIITRLAPIDDGDDENTYSAGHSTVPSSRPSGTSTPSNIIAPPPLTPLTNLPSSSSSSSTTTTTTQQPETWQTVSKSRNPTSTNNNIQDPLLTHAYYTSLATHHSTLHNSALSSASAAARKARSSPLMSAASAHYSQLSRAALASAHAASGHAADALVASQSSATVLDLHGTSVADAVRIARREVSRWYEGLGDAMLLGNTTGGGGGAMYTLIVGQGNHSTAGRAKIKPAVERALEAEGWKVEMGRTSGELVVLGKKRRK